MAVRRLTVDDVLEGLMALRRHGYGRAEVYLFTDEEGNGARPLVEGMGPDVCWPDTAGAYRIPVGCVLIG